MQKSNPLERPVNARCRLVIGVTSDQTCLVLHARVRAFQQAGYEVILVCSPGRFLNQLVEVSGVDAYPLPMKRAISPLNDLRSLLALWLLLLRIRPYVVEFSTPKAGLLGSIASLLANVPCRIYLLRGLKLETAHGLKRRVLLLAERIAAACAHHILCNSESLKALAVQLRIAPAAKISVLADGSSSGVDLVRFCPGHSCVRDALEIPRHAKVFGFAGRLTRDKGIAEFLLAFERLQHDAIPCYALLVGWFDEAEDELEDELKARLRNHPRIRLTGYVADTAPYYRAMDIFVLPTRREGFPNAILEAAATRLPVISSLCTGARDAVVPEVTGLLVEPGNVDALTDAMSKLLCEESRCLRMGAAARIWVERHYSMDRVLAEHVDFYKNRTGAAINEWDAAPEAV